MDIGEPAVSTNNVFESQPASANCRHLELPGQTVSEFPFDRWNKKCLGNRETISDTLQE